MSLTRGSRQRDLVQFARYCPPDESVCPEQIRISPYQVHIGYVIPSDRQVQPNAVSDLQALFPDIRSWYANQMYRYGFAPKTFQYETLPDGVTPKVWMTQNHGHRRPDAAESFRQRPWHRRVWSRTIE